MLDSLITSKTRIKLLLKFFLNHGTEAYLREMAEEFGESTNAVRVELNRLTKAGLLESRNDGRTVLYRANVKHALFSDLNSVVKKYLGIDQLIESVLARLGKVEMAFITGDYAEGKDSGIIDLAIVGEINKDYLNQLVSKTEQLIRRKIRVLTMTAEEYARLEKKIKADGALLIWNENGALIEK